MSEELRVPVTAWKDVGGSERTEVTVPWSRFVERLRAATPQAEKEKSPLLKLARFGEEPTPKGSLRHDGNVLAVTGVEGDHDSGTMEPEEAVGRLENHNLRAVVATTWSHTPEAPRWRVFSPLSHPVEPGERRRLVAGLNGILDGALGRESFALSQSYFIGPRPGGEYRVSVTFDDPDEGLTLDELDAAELEALARYPDTGASASDEGEAREGSAYRTWLERLQAGEEVHDSAARLTGRWVRLGLRDDEIRAIIGAFGAHLRQTRGSDRVEVLLDAELDRLLEGARRKFDPDEGDTKESPFSPDAAERAERARAAMMGGGA